MACPRKMDKDAVADDLESRGIGEQKNQLSPSRLADFSPALLGMSHTDYLL